MSRVDKITKDIIIDVYEYKKKFGDKITYAEIAKLVGIGESTVGKIFKGTYDHLLREEKNPEPQDISTQIDLSVLSGLKNMPEQISRLSNGLQSDHEETFLLIDNINRELVSIGDLLHIIAVALMRRETDKTCKTKMANQIQAVHTNKRISDALK